MSITEVIPSSLVQITVKLQIFLVIIQFQFYFKVFGYYFNQIALI